MKGSTETPVPNLILPTAADMPAGSDSFLRWLWFFARPYRHKIALFTIFRLFRYTVMNLLPFIIGRVIDAFDTGWAQTHRQAFLILITAYMAVYFGVMASILLLSRESRIEDRIVRGMTLFSIRHMNTLPLDWHEAQGSGSKLQRVMTARSSLKRLCSLYRWNIIHFLGSLIGIVLALVMSPMPRWLMLPYLALMVSYFGVAWLAARPIPVMHNRHNILFEKLLSGVYEFVSAVRTVKTFRMEGFIEHRARELEAQGHMAMRGVIRASFMKWTVLNIVGGFWLILIFALCVMGLYQGWLRTGAFATCFFLANNLWDRLDSMVQIQDDFIESRNGFMRLTETLNSAPVALDLAPVVAVPAGWDGIVLEHVTFSYPGAGAAALQNVTLTIRRGERVALVGRSGAGKSTLIKLLLKQVWPQEGMISVGGIDLRHIASTGWLRGIGYVPQDVELFNMSIRENIVLDRIGDIDDGAYRRAVDRAALTDFIASLPDADETLVGERGVKLSGGQRQRLGIARALIRDADIIVFDEATSALDSLSEAAIRAAIDTAFAGKTLILIAHRLATVRHADRIFVLDHGAVKEQGTFDELLALDGLFARFWALQAAGAHDSGF